MDKVVPVFPGTPEPPPAEISRNDLEMAFAELLILSPEMNHLVYGELRKRRGVPDPYALWED